MVYVAVVLPLLCGCRKDLCYDHESHSFSVKTDVAASWEQEWERTYAVDWEQEWNAAWRRGYDELRPEVSEGIRGVVYNPDGRFVENNLPAEGGRLPMSRLL